MKNTNYFGALRPAQITMGRNICVFIMVQWVLIFVGVVAMNWLGPKKTTMFTTNILIDFSIFLVVAMGLLYIIVRTQTVPRFPGWLRILAFYALGVWTSYLMGVQYNLVMEQSPHPAKTEQTFLFAWAITFAIFLVILLMTPFLLPFAKTIRTIGTTALIALIVLLLVYAALPVCTTSSHFTAFIGVALFIFLVLLFSNMVVITENCKTPKSIGCDALNGATTLYIDAVNILQNSAMALIYPR